MPPKPYSVFFEKPHYRGLKIYMVKFVVHGYLWFHSVATPTSIGWIHQVVPVIHNYPLILGILGYPVEETYANRLSEPKYMRTRYLIQAERLYVYPAIVKKLITRRIQFTGIGDGYASIRGKTRLSYPERGFNTVLLPGSELVSFVITEKGIGSLPRYVRIGSKRFGLLKAKYKQVEYRVVSDSQITHPANTYDTQVVTGGLLLLRHNGGDIVTMCRVRRAIEVKVREGKREENVILAYPSRILGDIV